VVEQVFYTWANEGLSGRGMLQPVAASRGFGRLSDGDHKRAMRLCSYDAGAAAANGYPTAFGWIDSGSTRFAFQRKYLTDPSIQRGRPGNFAAHVMVGPASVLSVPKLLASFGTASWWKGPDSLQELALPRSVEWSQLEVSPEMPADHDIAGGILSALISGQLKVRSRAQSDELVAALRRIAYLIPSLLEGLSFSTFEGASLSDWFDIVGNVRASSVAIAADAEYFLSNPRVASILPVVHSKTDPVRSNDLAAARSLIAVHRDLASGNADAESISQLLRFPEQVPLAIVEFPGFGDALATAISANSPSVVRALRSSGHAIPYETLRRIGRDVGRTATVSQVNAVYRSVSGLPAALQEAYTGRLLVRSDIIPFVATCDPENLHFFFESSEYGAASAELRRALESRLAGVGAPAHLFYSQLSQRGWNALFASLAKRRSNSWGLTSDDLGLVLSRAAGYVPEELEQFFLKAEGPELKTRVDALVVAPGLSPGAVGLGVEGIRRVLSVVTEDANLAQLLTVIDMSAIRSGSDQALLDRLVRRLLERYETDGSFLLPSGFWAGIEKLQDLARFAQAHTSGDRSDKPDMRVGPGWAGRTIAFLEFEQRLIQSSARLIRGTLNRQQLGWLAVVTLRAARQGAASKWVRDSLDVLVQHASSWQRIGSWLMQDSTYTAILQLLRYLAFARREDYELVVPFLDENVLASLQRGR
jgi:hypothetical protein